MTLDFHHLCTLDNGSLYTLYLNFSGGPPEYDDGDVVIEGGGGGNWSDLGNDLGNDSANDSANVTTFAEFAAYTAAACDSLHFDALVSLIVPMVFACNVVLGVIGNVLVIFVVLCGQQMQNTTNILILNLAIADLLFVTTCIPPTAVDYAIGWPFGETCCQLVQYLIHVSTYSSVYTLVLLSLDRYLAVVYPVNSKSWRTVSNTTVAIVVTWIIVLLACGPILFVYTDKELELPHGEVRSICTFDRINYSEQLYQSVFFATSLLLPLLAVLWLYVCMLLRLWRGVGLGTSAARSTRATAASAPAPSMANAAVTAANRGERSVTTTTTTRSSRGQEKKRRLTHVIVIVIIAFGLCWTPLQVVLLLRNFNLFDISQSGGLVILQIVTQCLAYCNSCLNPILYAFFSPNFRTAFLHVCQRSYGGRGRRQGQQGLHTERQSTVTRGVVAAPRGNGDSGRGTGGMEAQTNNKHTVEVGGRVGETLEFQPLVNGTTNGQAERNMTLACHSPKTLRDAYSVGVATADEGGVSEMKCQDGCGSSNINNGGSSVRKSSDPDSLDQHDGSKLLVTAL